MSLHDKPTFVLIGGSGYVGTKIGAQLIESGNNIISTYKSNTINHSSFIYLDLQNSATFQPLLDVLQSIKKVVIVFLSTAKNSSLILNLPEDKLVESFEVNLLGPHKLVQKLLPQMIKNKWGRFIFFSSTKAQYGDVGVAAYAATKAAISLYSRVVAIEYARYGITANVLSLGYFDGPLWSEMSGEKRANLLHDVPSKKLGDSVNITNSIRFIADSDYINGSIIKVDGGL